MSHGSKQISAKLPKFRNCKHVRFDPVLHALQYGRTDASNLLSSRPQTRDIDHKTSAN
jgi:hypothetical protein